MFFTYLEDTPVGRLLIAGDEQGLRHVSFEKSHFSAPVTTPETTGNSMKSD